MTAVAVAASAVQPVIVTVNLPATSSLLPMLQVCATVFVGLVGVYVAYTIQTRQAATAERGAKTAANKLRLDLFEKRSAIFGAADDLIRDTCLLSSDEKTGLRNRVSARKRHAELERLMNGANWLFDDAIAQFLDDCSRDAWKRINAHFSASRDDWSDEQWEEHLSADRERVKAQTEALESRFKPFMHIDAE